MTGRIEERRASADERTRGRAVLAVVYLVALGVACAVGWQLRDRHPIAVAAAADLAATIVVFGASVLAGNSSLYDPYWSVAPVPIAAYWATAPDGGSDLRRVLVLAIVCAWGARLTANQLVRWRGLGHEDFRYRELRAKSGRGYWPLSFVGIHLMPTVWVFLGSLPIYVALAVPGRPWNALDVLACVIAIGAIALEATADRQLRAFLARRHGDEAVLDAGVWRWSRHPNYLGEILFWWGLWMSGVAAAPGWAWTAIGPLAITLLFVFVSVPWMDRHMLSRHPAYGERVRATPALLPWRMPRREEPGARGERHGRGGGG